MVGTKRIKVAEICDEKFELSVQIFREEFGDEVRTKQAEQEEAMRPILMAIAQIRSNMNSIAEDCAAIWNLTS